VSLAASASTSNVVYGGLFGAIDGQRARKPTPPSCAGPLPASAMTEEKNIVLARVAERAERYDEMADFMKQHVEMGSPLSTEERDMFSAAFKNALTERRHAVRVAVGVAAQERAEGRPGNAGLAEGYKSKVEADLQSICHKALGLLEEHLVPKATDADMQTFFLKMQGDYYRYLAEFAQDETRARAAERAAQAYHSGMESAAPLHALHAVRLGLALNFSVFQHEVLQDTEKAKKTASDALASASAAFEGVDPAQHHDAALTMQLLQDNLSLWSQ